MVEQWQSFTSMFTRLAEDLKLPRVDTEKLIEAHRKNIDALKNVQFVMKDGQVFKKDGVMTPAAFFHGGPVNGWRIR